VDTIVRTVLVSGRFAIEFVQFSRVDAIYVIRTVILGPLTS